MYTQTLRHISTGLLLMATAIILPASVWADPNPSGTNFLQAYGNSFSYDPATDTTTVFSAVFSNGAVHVPGGAPDDFTYGYTRFDTYDATTGFLLSFGFGWVNDQSIPSGLTAASSSAEIDIYTFDPMSGNYVVTSQAIPVEVTFTAAGDAQRNDFHDIGRTSTFNFVSIQSARYKPATMSIVIDAAQVPVDDSLGIIEASRNIYMHNELP